MDEKGIEYFLVRPSWMNVIEDVLSSRVMEGVSLLYCRCIGYHVIRFDYLPLCVKTNATALDLSAHTGSTS